MEKPAPLTFSAKFSMPGGNWEMLEARAGIEPAHKGFADLSLTTWVPRPEPSDARRRGAQDRNGSRLSRKERAFGAGDRGRTGDIFLGKEALYH